MSLQVLHRPKSLKTFAGNDEIKQSLEEILKRKNPPASFLIVGPSGCGKTSLGRIIAKMLGCSKEDYKETNAANDRTLPAIRKIIDDMQYAPMAGKKKVILMDECFSGDTIIFTPNGAKRIDSVKIDDAVFNLNGVDVVEKVFANKIPLDRVARINKSNGTFTFCSKDHEYYIDDEWVHAKDLTNRLLVNYNDSMLYNELLHGGQNDIHTSMSFLQKRIYQYLQVPTILFKKLYDETSLFSKTSKTNTTKNLRLLRTGVYSEKRESNFLFSFLCRKIQSQNQQHWQSQKTYITKTMRILQNYVYSKESKSSILFSQMSRYLDSYTRINQKENVHTRKSKKCKKRIEKIPQNRVCQNFTSKIFRKNEKKQPVSQSQKYRKSQSYQKIKRYFAYLARNPWGQWAINRTPEVTYDCVGMGSGSSNSYGRSFTYGSTQTMEQQEKGSYKLQSRYRKSKIENSDRGGFEKPSMGTFSKKRQKERILIKMERVESVEIYKRGDNDESFASIIGDKERDQGYVTFYDLQIKTNHSYIANNNMVHNCHQLQGPTQEALLKALEEPPSHVHFILCTTNPEALKDTLKRRCHIYEVQALNSNQMMKHLRTILKKEKIKDFKEEILEKIIELSDGSPGIALKYLDMVIDMTDEKEAISLLKSSGTSENDVKQLCQALVDFRVNDKTRWNRVKKILKDFKGDAESARRPILGYLNSCLLNNPVGDNFAIIMDEFKDNFYDSGKAGLSLAAFKACHIMDED
jgi:DNA polymerase III gamma/tau subunit